MSTGIPDSPEHADRPDRSRPAGDATRRELPAATLAARTAVRSLTALGFEGLLEHCRRHCAGHEPEPELRRDPRDDLPIVTSRKRAARLTTGSCPVCDAETCPAVDVVELPDDDHAWLTPNLYPLLFPPRPGATAFGVHLVQWSSRRHAGGWPDAGRALAVALMAQLARAEEFLLHEAGAPFPETGEGHRGWMLLLKNHGRRVGGSVQHDHQQLALSGTPPLAPREAAGLHVHLRDGHVVDEIDGRARIVVPSFMRRPLQAFIVPADDTVGAGFLHHLDADTRDATAVALARLTGAVNTLMRADGADPAWNVIVHAGPGCGPLFELRPATQPLGGFEQLGLYACEETPERSAARFREVLDNRSV